MMITMMTMLVIVTLVLLQMKHIDSFSPSAALVRIRTTRTDNSSHKRCHHLLTATTSGRNHDDDGIMMENTMIIKKDELKSNLDRRNFFQTSSLVITAAASSLVASNPSIVYAASDNTSTNEQTEEDTLLARATAQKQKQKQIQIANLLQPIPTFTIVDKRGVPYMVVGEDAKLTAYFFTNYNEADRILKLASSSADKALLDLQNEIMVQKNVKSLSKQEIEEEVGINPWRGARISTVPLDFAVTLASKGKIAGSYFRIAPSESDIEDALEVDTTTTDLPEGKVPLFYYEDFELPTSPKQESSTTSQVPLYFQKEQLIQAYKKQNPKVKQQDYPPMKVTELFSVLTTIMTSSTEGNSGSSDGDGDGSVDQDDLDKLIIIPPTDSSAKAKACLQKGSGEEAFRLRERIVVL